ncbi:MAG TPA: hypothetical protein DDW30_07040 [Clostridiales bacterium]|nr:hypothetical protein [Clostridiales bacterium]
MKFCPYCGAKLPSENTDFCIKCGRYFTDRNLAAKSTDANCAKSIAILSFFLPELGFILGIVLIATGYSELGRSALRSAGISLIIRVAIAVILLLIFIPCYFSEVLTRLFEVKQSAG